MLLPIPFVNPSAIVALAGNIFRSAPLLARRGESEEMIFWLVVFVVVIGVVCGAIFLATHYVNRRRYNSHSSLFYALCGVHDLDRSDRAMLKQVVRHHDLAQPARVFTEPQWLNPAALGEPFASKSEQLLALQKQLFAIDKTV